MTRRTASADYRTISSHAGQGRSANGSLQAPIVRTVDQLGRRQDLARHRLSRQMAQERACGDRGDVEGAEVGAGQHRAALDVLDRRRQAVDTDDLGRPARPAASASSAPNAIRSLAVQTPSICGCAANNAGHRTLGRRLLQLADGHVDKLDAREARSPSHAGRPRGHGWSAPSASLRGRRRSPCRRDRRTSAVAVRRPIAMVIGANEGEGRSVHPVDEHRDRNPAAGQAFEILGHLHVVGGLNTTASTRRPAPRLPGPSAGRHRRAFPGT